MGIKVVRGHVLIENYVERGAKVEHKYFGTVYKAAKLKDVADVEKKLSEKESTPSVLPSILSTPLALSVLSKYQKAGYLDKDYQPINLSRAEKAIVAHSIAEELNIQKMWSLFEPFWGINSMSAAYTRGLKETKAIELMAKINTL